MPRQAPKIASIYNGGYSEGKKKRLQAVVLPEKTRCFECSKWKNTTVAFSEKQQNDLRNGLASGQIAQSDMAKGWITCRTCVGVQKMEMQCVVCDKVKGLDGFAKAQRRDPDNARCLRCVTEYVNKDPVDKTTGAEDDAFSSGSDSDDTASNIYGSSIDDTDDLESDRGVPLPAHEQEENQKLHFSPEPSTKASTSKASTTASTTPSVPGVNAWQTMSNKHGKNNGQYTGYDSQGKAHVRTYSSAASTISNDSDATTTRANTLAHDKPTSKFAKVPAHKKEVIIPDHDDVGGRNVRYESSSDEDDEDGFFTY